MDQGQILLKMRRAPDDPAENDPKFQEELREFSKSLHATGLTFSQRAIAFDSVDAIGHPLAEFVIGRLGLPLIGAVAHVCATWVKARTGRKLRLKIGDVVAEAETVEDIERLMKQAAEFCAANPKRGGKK
jgi:hypothetical protein